MDKVRLVDFFGNSIKCMDKLKAHDKPHLHLAFSIFLIDGDKVLIQKRAKDKYHSGGLWSNTCCSHYLDKKSLLPTATKRLCEELNILCGTMKIGEFTYFAQINGVYEYEIDSVLVGEYSGGFKLNKQEASNAKWVKISSLVKDVTRSPLKYTAWFTPALKILVDYMLAKGIWNAK